MDSTSAPPAHGLVAADAAAGVGEKAVVLAAAAVFVLPGDDDLLQRLEPEKAAALHDIIVYAETVEKFGQKNRIGDQEGVSFGFFQLPDQQVGAGGDVLPGLRLAGISGLALGGSFPKPLFRRERMIRIREGADTDLVQKRFNMKLTRFENLFSRGAGEKALSDIDDPVSRGIRRSEGAAAADRITAAAASSKPAEV